MLSYAHLTLNLTCAYGKLVSSCFNLKFDYRFGLLAKNSYLKQLSFSQNSIGNTVKNRDVVRDINFAIINIKEKGELTFLFDFLGQILKEFPLEFLKKKNTFNYQFFERNSNLHSNLTLG